MHWRPRIRERFLEPHKPTVRQSRVGESIVLALA
jgi:hypothetical protein